MTTQQMPPPTITLGGTDAETLEAGWRAVADAANDLLTSLSAVEFNRRDYPHDWQPAIERMREWTSAAHDISGESVEVVGSIMDQREARR